MHGIKMHQLHRAGVVAIAVVLLSWTASAFSFQDVCPNKESCTCTQYEIICNCDNRQNVTVTSMFTFDIHTIIISGCGVVRLPLTSLINLQLYKLEVNDAQELHISSYALAGVLGLHKLSLQNIQMLEVKPHAFSGLLNISHIEIDNVTIPTLSQWAFGGVTDIGLLSISNSIIGTVETFAFILSNVTTMQVSNTKVDTFMNTSILIHNANHLEFTNCFFNNTENSTFSLAEIGTLEFTNCSILYASGDMIFAKQISTFIFDNCFVEKLCHKALWSIEVVDHLKFTGNSFEITEPGSLFSTIGPFGTIHGNMSVEVHNNSFICDCKIVWLWVDNHLGSYKTFLDSSYCSGPTKLLNVQLKHLWPKSGKDERCVEISTKQNDKIVDKVTTKSTLSNGVIERKAMPIEAESAFSTHSSSTRLLSHSLQTFAYFVLAFFSLCLC